MNRTANVTNTAAKSGKSTIYSRETGEGKRVEGGGWPEEKTTTAFGAELRAAWHPANQHVEIASRGISAGKQSRPSRAPSRPSKQ